MYRIYDSKGVVDEVLTLTEVEIYFTGRSISINIVSLYYKEYLYLEEDGGTSEIVIINMGAVNYISGMFNNNNLYYSPFVRNIGIRLRRELNIRSIND